MAFPAKHFAGAAVVGLLLCTAILSTNACDTPPAPSPAPTPCPSPPAPTPPCPSPSPPAPKPKPPCPSPTPPAPRPPMPKSLICFIKCGLKVITCSLTCLGNPLCFIGCGMDNEKCIIKCNATIGEDPAFAAKTNTVMIESKETSTIVATAILISTGSGKENAVNGSLQFLQDFTGENIQIKGRIVGLSPGIHGLSIHPSGSCDSVAGHSNPLNKDHGAPWDDNNHAGDLGNIVAGQDGIAEVSIKAKTIQLIGANSVLGREIIVHADADDLATGTHENRKIDGNPGAALACGIIEM